jgi:hypothetical protein
LLALSRIVGIDLSSSASILSTDLYSSPLFKCNLDRLETASAECWTTPPPMGHPEGWTTPVALLELKSMNSSPAMTKASRLSS